MNKEFRIAKEFNWEMSHRLGFHNGLCRNIHGHSYKLRLELSGDLNVSSMVLDYYDIKKTISPIIEQLDHAFLCDKNDNLMIDFLAANGFKYVVMDGFTTAENIAEYILHKVSPEFAKHENIKTVTVRIYETEDAYAELTLTLRDS